ncbi:hypothetical protein CR513_34479, partial [Mucuna pruriens]
MSSIEALGSCNMGSSLFEEQSRPRDLSSFLLTRCFLIGYFVFLGKSFISWKTKKQVIVSSSLAKLNIDLWPQQLCLILRQCDYIVIVKHIEVDCHYIRDEI